MVVGLGNPGGEYAGTRHNVGFDVVDRLASRWEPGGTPRVRSGARVLSTALRGERCLLVWPQQFMNRSGQPVASLLHYYKVPLDRLVVVHDDMDLPFGTIRCKRGGGAAGHNGLRDLDRHVGKAYARVRVGIGRPPAGWEGARFVLARWTPEQRDALDGIVDRAADAAETIVLDGLETAMNRFNARPSRRRKPNPDSDAGPPATAGDSPGAHPSPSGGLLPRGSLNHD